MLYDILLFGYIEDLRKLGNIMFRFGFFLLLKSHKRFINKRANAKFLSVFLTRIKFHFYGREWCYMLFDDGFNHLTNNIEKNHAGKYMKRRRKVNIP